MLWKIIVELVIGALCGFAANKIMGGDSGSILKNILLGIVGGFVGGLIGNLIGLGGGWITGILLAIGGACLVVWLFRKLFK
ncbi:MAG: GlsB/YeaQ/YmgE family stress response membrane protein [Clostridia bacterium]|nr:GlsB/YeaQ/YmgE family stress response membrane protein [Clostridia bacterium]